MGERGDQIAYTILFSMGIGAALFGLRLGGPLGVGNVVGGESISAFSLYNSESGQAIKNRWYNEKIEYENETGEKFNLPKYLKKKIIKL